MRAWLDEHSADFGAGNETVVAFAIMALTKLRAIRAVDEIAKHVDSHIPITKKSARTAIAKLRPAEDR